MYLSVTFFIFFPNKIAENGMFKLGCAFGRSMMLAHLLYGIVKLKTAWVWTIRLSAFERQTEKGSKPKKKLTGCNLKWSCPLASCNLITKNSIGFSVVSARFSDKKFRLSDFILTVIKYSFFQKQNHSLYTSPSIIFFLIIPYNPK